MIDKHKLEQKYNNFGNLSTKFWLKGNNRSEGQNRKAEKIKTRGPNTGTMIFLTMRLNNLKTRKLNLPLIYIFFI